MSLADDLDHLDPETRDRVLSLFEIDADGPGYDDELDHAPGTAVPIDGPLPADLHDLEGSP